ncbi:Cysteinyl-tRNA synthetase [hydrothermal vent metagenome]|uniref:Cysteine--tRNA ligase n=1 Tax=hydrothermal vent metagenome TaxID=652676 RepID=A0A3B1DG00_9ZZZZ
MALRVYNTLTRQKEDFQTITPDKVTIYLCGPTVYKPAHVGHMVGPIIFDTVKKYLAYSGYEVTYVINITDVDDKLINRARENNTTVKALAGEMIKDYFENLSAVGVDSVDHFPYATDHIQEMQDIIATLIGKDLAYPLEGDVYFDVTKDKDYGKLSGRNVEEMMAGTRVEANRLKRNPADFALWKGAKEGELSWESPWGKGRPGWHIECSAMSQKLLGETIDIHGGGLDLMFPHHENELAQSESCTGKPFATYWMHNGLMQASNSTGKLGGEHNKQGDVVADQTSQEAGKLSGSQGAASVKELFEKFTPEVVRFFLLSTHYRSPMEFSDELLAETAKGIEGFYRLFETYQRISGNSFYDIKVENNRNKTSSFTKDIGNLLSDISTLRGRFLESMDDDFNTGGAIGVLFEIRKRINGHIAEHQLDSSKKETEEDIAVLGMSLTILKELAMLLGVFCKPIEKVTSADDGLVDGLMQLIIELRADARENKNWDIADKIRDGLNHLKITVEDRTDETLWRKE